MTKRTYLIDVDGVLADFAGAWLREANAVTGRENTAADLREWEFERALGLTPDQAGAVAGRMRAPGWCWRIQPLRPKPSLKNWPEGSQVRIVTAPYVDHPTWCHERLEWLRLYFGIHEDRVVFARDKSVVRGDVFVDDSLANVVAWQTENMNGIAIVWDQPWNRTTVAVPRASSWEDVWRLADEFFAEKQRKALDQVLTQSSVLRGYLRLAGVKKTLGALVAEWGRWDKAVDFPPIEAVEELVRAVDEAQLLRAAPPQGYGHTADLSRTQLVGMAASLRGELDNLVQLYKLGYVGHLRDAPTNTAADVQDSFADAATTLAFSRYEPSPEDLLPGSDGLPDGTFDDSWMRSGPAELVAGV